MLAGDAATDDSMTVDPARTEEVAVTATHSKPDSIRNFIAPKLTEARLSGFRWLAIY